MVLQVGRSCVEDGDFLLDYLDYFHCLIVSLCFFCKKTRKNINFQKVHREAQRSYSRSCFGDCRIITYNCRMAPHPTAPGQRCMAISVAVFVGASKEWLVEAG